MEQNHRDPNEAYALSGSFGSSTNIPAPQKRAYDYGEELKGLSVSEDEGSSGERSTSAFKRRKTGQTGGARSGSNGSGSDSEGLDDGEIVESPPPLPVAPSTSTANPRQIGVESHIQDTSNASKDASSEDGEIIASPGSREYSGQTSDTNEGRDSGEPRQDEGMMPAVNRDPQAPHLGWNRGIQLGTRTTFGMKPANTFFGDPPTAAKTIDGNEEHQADKEKKRVRSRDPVSSFEAGNSTWNFPLSASKIIAPANISEEDGFWTTLLKDWVVHLVRANGETADRLTYKVVRSGWLLYFTRRMGYIQGTKKHMTATRSIAQTFMASVNKGDIDVMISDARQKQPIKQASDGISGTSTSLPSRDKELRLQTKYFPSAEDPSRYCLSCSGTGHTTPVCPELSCRFCKSENHHSFGCPTRRRCDKCRQTGHSVDECTEKLALAPDELGGCAFCGAGHQDDDCSEIWRSFKPSESNIKKVKSIPAFCYVCGGENHYGPECSLSSMGDRVVDSTTWSKTNRDIYVDPNSEDVAIAWAGTDPVQPAKGEFHILGRATRNNHTYFVSSDESEEDLIHAPIKRPQTRSGIRIASNIGTVNGNPRGRGGTHKSWQPPLPPGPPPPLPTSQSTPSGTLPPRPQTSTRGRPSGRGRGGLRGRGRGRGRGK